MLEKAQEILDKLPSPITSEHCSTAITSHSIKLEEMSPYWMLLSSEVVALNECLFMLEAALKGVVRGIKEVMPESIFQEIYVKLAQDTVPNSWKVFTCISYFFYTVWAPSNATLFLCSIMCCT